ncbi:MAG: FtsX-like permease family protein [Thermoanaerobaculia bacterium]|nr:FtsX-like permease family protein [Thermoanaerobaculia bacterium]
MTTFRLAWRNIWRNSRRTAVTVAAMTLALVVSVNYGAIMTGLLASLEGNILDLEMGDIQVFAPDYRDRPSIYSSVDGVDADVAALESEGYEVTPRLLAGGLAASDETSAGAMVRGIDPGREAGATLIHEHVERGEWLDPADPRGIVLGRRLAKSLAVAPGDEVILLSTSTDGSIANDLYTVRGVLGVISDATDRAAVYMLEETFRDLFYFESGAHQLLIRTPGGVDLATAVAHLRAIFAELDVQSWRDLLPTMAQMLDSAAVALSIVMFIVYIAIGITVINAMLMAVFERVREFGVLKAIGVEPGRVFRMIVIESAMQTGLAIVAGLVLSLPILWYVSEVGIDVGALGGASMGGMAMDPIWRGVVSPMTFIRPVLLLILMVALAVIYPAAKAARIQPVEAMRYQ